MAVANAAGERPTIRIAKVEQEKLDQLTVLDWFVKATDNKSIAKIDYRVALDGKRSGWGKYPYSNFPGYVNHLPCRVTYHLFVFKVRSIDKDGNKSSIAKRTFENLRWSIVHRAGGTIPSRLKSILA